MQYKDQRPAIAMIELIFALVIMGIALMSAPMLVSTATKSTTVALQQEGINEAASRIAMIMTYPWDENDLNDSCIPPVLRVSQGDSALNEVNTTANPDTGRRIGVPKDSDSRTFLCGGSRLDASAIGSEGGDRDDIDDFSGTGGLVSIDGGPDYIETTTVNIATSIYYTSDTASYNSSTFGYSFSHATAAPTTNIKGISVTLTSTSGVNELQKTIVLHGFSCNIGGMEFAKRQF